MTKQLLPFFANYITSSAALAIVLAVSTPSRAQVLFSDDFDSYGSPSTITAPGTANGYSILFGPGSSPTDFTAIFGFDYSTVVDPTTIPSAPNSTGGTTKGLFLTVNKDA